MNDLEPESAPTRAFACVEGAPTAPLFLTCEHAGRSLPEWRPTADEAHLVADHWGWDIGAGHLTRALARRLDSSAVLASFSRLVCDPNRAPHEASYIVEEVEGRRLSFNRDLDDAERRRRTERYFEPYHDAVDRALSARMRHAARPRLCSVHSFTPVHGGERREMEVGVLFDAHEGWAEALAVALSEEGFHVARNEPYSGYAGLIYAASRHGRAHGIPYLEIEVRNDLLRDPGQAEAVSERVGRALRRSLADAVDV